MNNQQKNIKKRLDRLGDNMVQDKIKESKAVGTQEIEEAIEQVDSEKQERQEQGVKELKVNIAVWADDQTVVLNKDPSLYYVFARKDDPIEIADCAKKGYHEAVGDEIVFGMTCPTPGKPKILNGDRILMCCPQAMVDARNQAMKTRRDKSRKFGNLNKAQELQSSVVSAHIGVSVYDGTPQG